METALEHKPVQRSGNTDSSACLHVNKLSQCLRGEYCPLLDAFFF